MADITEQEIRLARRDHRRTLSVLVVGGVAVFAWFLSSIVLGTNNQWHNLLDHPAGLQMEMSLPMLRGVTSDEQSYEIFARSAHRVPGNHGTPGDRNPLTLAWVRGSFDVRKGHTFSFTSPVGEYASRDQSLTFVSTVEGMDRKGTTFHTDRATVDLRTGDVTGEHSISIDHSDFSLRSGGFRVKENGKQVSFFNNVHVEVKNGFF